MRVHKPTWRLKHTSLLRPSPPFRARVAARLLHIACGSSLKRIFMLAPNSLQIHREFIAAIYRAPT
jgi:hypothetical protein